MRAAILIRTGSIYPCSDFSAKSPRSLTSVNDAGVSFYLRSHTTRLSLDVRGRRDLPSTTEKPNPLRRVRSDMYLIGSPPPSPCVSRWSPPARLSREEEDDLVEVVAEEVDFSGDGKKNGRKTLGGSCGDGRNGRVQSIGSYYQKKLRADPGNLLLLRNYGRFLHEVEGDLGKAEEYYCRAILASPYDGELLSIYGRLLWESQRDRKLAEAYYKRAVAASPDNCYVLGSYANFLWDAEDDEEESVT